MQAQVPTTREKTVMPTWRAKEVRRERLILTVVTTRARAARVVVVVVAAEAVEKPRHWASARMNTMMNNKVIAVFVIGVLCLC